MRLRSELTTGGPIVRTGTKWPSITSTCSRSASVATRSTSAASSEKSADRIDGAIFMGVTLMWGWDGNGGGAEDEDEHPVGSRGARQQQRTPTV